jgi:hypothetical protein
MDFRDRSIITQVAFKGAIELGHELDLTDPEGQAQFETIFAYLTNSLMLSVGEPEERAAQVIQANFPGAVQVPNVQPNVPPPPQNPQYQVAPVSVKGNQFGPLPEWLYEQAANAGITEVYDNRDRIAGTRRPWFRATTGGDRAVGFWPPRQ